MPIPHYIIVESYHSSDLATKVNDKLKEGYELQGGISSSKIMNSNYFYQAMVKWPEPEGN